MKKILNTIAGEIQEVLAHVDAEQTVQLAEQIQKADRIFIAGTGRSGLAGKMFAMRLMHSGYQVYVVGETITPSLESGDLLLLISGSGGTASLLNYAKKAKEIEAMVTLVTTNPQSAIGEYSSQIVRIPAATKKRLESEPETIQPLGSQFDQSAHLILDSIIVYLLQTYPGNRSEASLNQKHTNLE
ncbi:6-phospho-3-hexuloisomerase [Oceanobacillus sp. J11TS1]|uniref:6-phospho-3-hexuloisomerase n=1 Tax=Oceanobacillus sp. J11TS1 TaxID=2807191 RepID=UPI001B0A09CF|nr:6-phospho-3-hexuloisomerase [Oceanobacillus sp. J11TS1]GIO24530.1 3-hexulose-6-phosphate isomerase [Oceanobacillus sp. J11TS1]